jgi:hypothetical protein
MHMMGKGSARAVTLSVLLLLSVLAQLHAEQRGALTASRNLADLVAESGVILRGRIVSTRVEPHPQFSALWTVVVTLQVDEAIKGANTGTYTFRQFIWDPRDRQDAAGYQKGQRLLLLLTAPNANGLSSPVGLEQGRFQLSTDAAGNVFAANGRNNAGLLNGLAARASSKGIRLAPRAQALVSSPPQGPLALDDLVSLIRQFASVN